VAGSEALREAASAHAEVSKRLPSPASLCFFDLKGCLERSRLALCSRGPWCPAPAWRLPHGLLTACICRILTSKPRHEQVENEWLRQYHFQLFQLTPHSPLARYWAPRIARLLTLWAQLEWLMALWLSVVFGHVHDGEHECRGREEHGVGCGCGISSAWRGCGGPWPQAASTPDALECHVCARWEAAAGLCRWAIRLLDTQGVRGGGDVPCASASAHGHGGMRPATFGNHDGADSWLGQLRAAISCASAGQAASGRRCDSDALDVDPSGGGPQHSEMMPFEEAAGVSGGPRGAKDACAPEGVPGVCLQTILLDALDAIVCTRRVGGPFLPLFVS